MTCRVGAVGEAFGKAVGKTLCYRHGHGVCRAGVADLSFVIDFYFLLAMGTVSAWVAVIWAYLIIESEENGRY